MTDESWVDDVKVEDLPDTYRPLVELVGLRHALRLSQAHGGTYHYIPKMDKVLNVIRDKKIRAEFTGFNHRDLARKYGLSETWIRQIVESKDDDRQESLFPAPSTDAPLPP